ncbi:hypothetical protein FHG87_018221 [Trinorchestia longiramus]|nr:hypothetical protein FHG87_018221 [Trinorchestia longiramus]
MKVKLAAQVFSNSTAAALDNGVAQTLTKAAVAATSSYCKKMNDIFDVVNSVTSKCSVPLRKPISTNSYRYEFLRESVLWLQELQALNAKKRCSFINGWIQSINVILQLRQRLDEYQLPYLSTRYLCQDGLECFFGKIQFLQKFPDARSFTDNYAKIASASFMWAPLSANCQTVDDQLELTVAHFLMVGAEEKRQREKERERIRERRVRESEKRKGERERREGERKRENDKEGKKVEKVMYDCNAYFSNTENVRKTTEKV